MSFSKFVRSVLVLGLIAMSVMAVNASVSQCRYPETQVLIDCSSYLRRVGGSKPNPQCCVRAKVLENLTGYAASYKSMCECFTEWRLKPEVAKEFSSRCHLNFTIPARPYVNCDNIK